MTDVSNFGKYVPWNKGKIVGAKPPLRPKYVWSIRTKLQVEGRLRDLALFNIAIDSKLRGCDVVGLKVDDVAPSGYAADRASVRQKKTGRPVKFELTESTRQTIDDYLRATGKKRGDCLFTGRRGSGCSLTTRQYARLLSGWPAGIGWILTCSERMRSVEQRRPLSIGAPATCEPCSCFWGTPKSRAPSGTWELKSTMRSR